MIFRLLSHPHNAMSDTGRNIATVLHDREKYGSKAIIRLCQFNRYRQNELHDSPSSPSRIELCRISLGDRSPSTVLESPVQSRETLTSEMEIVSEIESTLLTSSSDAHRHQNQQQQHSTINSITQNDTTTKTHTANNLRRVTYPISIAKEIRTFGEYCSATKYHSAFLTHLGGDDPLDSDGNLPPSSRAVSTISVAFAHDGHTMASTHGDHTVKISCCSTGRLLQSLEGHPRTPWTIKYHPTDSRILASGCLGHQVRVWNWEAKACLQMIRLECAIISLSFHPSGTVLAIANGSRLHFWGINDVETEPSQQSANLQPGATPHPAATAISEGATRSALLTEMDQRHMLRCVHFPPNGKTLIIGGVNPMTDDSRRPLAGGGPIAGGSMSFYLRLWDFDIEKALEVASSNATFSRPGVLDGVVVPTARRAIFNVSCFVRARKVKDLLRFSNFTSIVFLPCTKPRTFVPRALLYNDGGFDLDFSGNVLCVCAELFLPDGVNNAMELLHKEQWSFEEQHQDGESTDEINDAIQPDIAHDGSEALLTNAIVNAEAQPPVFDAPLVLDNANSNFSSRGSSVSFREEMEDSISGIRVPRTPNNTSPERHTVQYPQDTLAPTTGFIPMTPPVSVEPRFRNLSPPPPPGSRFMGRGILRTRDVGSYGHGHSGHSQYATTHGGVPFRTGANRGLTTPPPTTRMGMRPPHPLSVISSSSSAHSLSPNSDNFGMKGRYVPHVVTVSLDTSPIPEEIRDASIARGKPPGAVARGYRPRLGQLLEAYPLDASKASAVTCVKFSPSADFCLIGYGVRDPVAGGGINFHPVTAIFRVRGGMDHVSTMLSGDDDVNIARFHPDSGHSFVYGTKQGRVRVLSPRPWNFYGDS